MKKKMNTQNRMPAFQEKIRSPKAYSMTLTYITSPDKDILKAGRTLNGLPVLLYRAEDNKYIAKCLPFNQLGCGNTKEDAFKDLAVCLGEMLEDAIENDYIEDMIKDAQTGVGWPEKFYWDEYAKAKRIQSRQAFRPIKELSIGRSTITTRPPIDIRPFRLESQLSHAY